MDILAISAALALIGEPGCEAASEPLAAMEAHKQADELRPAQRQAERAIDAAPRCVLAHMAMIGVLQDRLEDAGGLTALNLSRRYRRAVADALALDPDHVGARTAEIRYLIHAPGIAGGDQERAAARIGSLSDIDPASGARMSLELARENGDMEAVIAALETLIPLTEDASEFRTELAYRLITTGQYDRAEATLLEWPQGDPQMEADRAYYRGALRVLGAFELDAAEPLLTQALEAEPDEDASDGPSRSASIWGLIGGAREQLENLDGAREAYERALALNPENTRAAQALERLNAP